MDSSFASVMPQGSSTIAGDVDSLFNFIFYSSAVIFGLVVFAIIFFIVRYRRKGEATKTSGVDHNLTLEIVWTVIPTILIIIVFIWGFKDYVRMFVTPHDAMEVKVTGQKWFWSFDYPEGANSVNELVVPFGRPVKLLMSSKDVIHSFFVPDFRVKMDVLPNRYSITWFQATDTGSYDLFCTEFCGKGHSEMIAKVRVLPEEEFIKWLDESSASGEGMTLEEFGAKLYRTKACYTCHSVDNTKNVGPSFNGIFGKMEKMEDGSEVLSDENYIRESILNPKAKVVAGYEPVMPTYQTILKDRQIDALIAYIKSLK